MQARRPKIRLMLWRALEGSGDLRAAFLKNLHTQDREQPQGGNERQGA
jgi:hypothetical protein